MYVERKLDPRTYRFGTRLKYSCTPALLTGREIFYLFYISNSSCLFIYDTTVRLFHAYVPVRDHLVTTSSIRSKPDHLVTTWIHIMSVRSKPDHLVTLARL